MTPLRFAMIGAGFWARFQLAAWRELPGVECVAVCDRNRARAEALDIPAVYDDLDALLRRENVDFIDVVTGVESHPALVRRAAASGIPVVCQKPMAPSLEEAESMVRACREARAPFFVHENWRWQAPIRALQRELKAGRIGRPFRARLQFSSSFPVFENQPALKELDPFILADVGSHHLDVARFLFGEAESLACHTSRVHPEIRGEDVATVLLRMASGVAVVVELSYASRLREERFPETFITVEGSEGCLELGLGCVLHTTTKVGTCSRRCPPGRYAWADPAYDLVHASIVPCNADLLKALRGEGPAETSAEDNLNTVRLVFAAVESARTGTLVRFPRD